MLQALYSRSAESVEKHIEKVKQTGSGKFMERYYVGYGHASIADCGSTTLFLEDVSMLVAKAVEDWPLYSGQETSTRYIDMSKQAIIDPIGTAESRTVLDNWMEFYIGSQTRVLDHLRQIYPRRADEDEATYERALAARRFDALRSFLPAGITTQLSWHTNLRQARDKIDLLLHYPLEEVRQATAEMLRLLQAKYGHSFGQKEYPESEKYRALLGQKFTFYNSKKYVGDFAGQTKIKTSELTPYRELLKKRPPKTNLPVFLAEYGMFNFDFLLDFGSFRDIHRHRNGVCRMPLLTTKYGFNEWYLKQLPADLKSAAKNLIKEQKIAIKKLEAKSSKLEAQYYIAMGFNVSCRVAYGLPATVYVIELRTGKMVHPTLRRVAQKMYHFVHKKFPEITLHPDLDLDDWDIRRGNQGIVEKE